MTEKTSQASHERAHDAHCHGVAIVSDRAGAEESNGHTAFVRSPGDLEAELHLLRRKQRDAEKTIRDLKDAVAARDAVIATAGHELRNPMSAIVVSVSNMQFLARREGSLPDWVNLRLQALDRQARNFVRRATTLLDVSRLTTGQLSLDREHVDLSALVKEVVSEMASAAECAGCPLQVAIDEGAVGQWDRAAIEQIVLNLLSNAIKYGAGRPVLVSLKVESARVVVAVRDGGAGIAKSDQARIFERFERAATRRERPGFGLGLWIARRLVVAHGGELTVESTPGVGSVFTAALPRG